MSRRLSAMRPTRRVALANAISRKNTSETTGGATVSTLGSEITATRTGDGGKPTNRTRRRHRYRDLIKWKQPQPDEQQAGRNTQLARTLAESDTSDLVTEVRIPDDPDGVIPPDHPALAILGNSSLLIQRQLEMMNVMLGFEQANRYIIMDGQGQTLGYIAEQDHGIGRTMARQLLRTHRSFTTHIFDAKEREILRIHRPFTYINSRIRVYDPIPEGGYENTETSTALQGTSASSAMNSGTVATVSPLKLGRDANHRRSAATVGASSSQIQSLYLQNLWRMPLIKIPSPA